MVLLRTEDILSFLMTNSQKTRGLRALTLLICLTVVVLVSTRAMSSVSTVVVIVHPELSIDTLAVEELQLMYLGKRSRWPDDTKVRPALIKSGAIHESFVNDVLDRTPAKFNSYWKQLVFTGKGVPPKSFASEQDLIEYVMATPGAVGYVSPATRPDGVRMIVVD